MPRLAPFRFRNPLAFPAGRIAGFDPTHIAASPLARGSFVARGDGTFANLLTGQSTTAVSTPVSTIDPIIGQSVVANAAAKYNTFASPFSDAASNLTMAAILTPTATAALAGIFSTSTSNSAFNRISLSSLQLTYASNGITASSGISLTANLPYFVAVSAKNSGLAGSKQFIAANLLTGQIMTGAAAGSISVIPTATWTLGDLYAGADPADCNIAAIMFSLNLLSAAQLLAWAADPWSYWYPPRLDDVIFAALSGAPPALAGLGWSAPFEAGFRRIAAPPEFSLAFAAAGLVPTPSTPQGWAGPFHAAGRPPSGAPLAADFAPPPAATAAAAWGAAEPPAPAIRRPAGEFSAPFAALGAVPTPSGPQGWAAFFDALRLARRLAGDEAALGVKSAGAAAPAPVGGWAFEGDAPSPRRRAREDIVAPGAPPPAPPQGWASLFDPLRVPRRSIADDSAPVVAAFLLPPSGWRGEFGEARRLVRAVQDAAPSAPRPLPTPFLPSGWAAPFEPPPRLIRLNAEFSALVFPAVGAPAPGPAQILVVPAARLRELALMGARERRLVLAAARLRLLIAPGDLTGLI